MRRRYVLVAIVALVSVVALTIGIVIARADQPSTLPSVSAAELLFKMATTDHHDLAVSGTASWTNDLLGQSGLVDTTSYGPAQSPLLASGSGRVWFQDGNLRFESQGQGGDQVAVFNRDAHTAWVYTSVDNKATEYKLPAEQAGPGASPEPSPTGTFGPADIQKYIEQMATTAKVTVAGQTTVAGRAAYLLELTPTATDTAFGKAQVAVDGSTYLPLRLEVYAAGHDKPTLSFAFDSISYDRVDASLFTFTPPADAKVEHQDLAAQMKAHGADAQSGAPWEQGATPGQKFGDGDAQAGPGHSEPKPLTVAQAQARAGFPVLVPQDYQDVRAFQGAWIVEKSQIEKQLEAFQKANGGSDAQAPAAELTATPSPSASESAQKVPQIDFAKLPQQAVVMQYGEGFGTIWFVQAPSTPELDKQLAKLPEQVAKEPIAGHQAWKITTPLGGAIVWKQGDLTLMAGGGVTAGDLGEFVAAVR